MSLSVTIDKAAELNLRKADIEKQLKGIKETIKENGEGSYEGTKYIATVSSSVKSRKLNQNKALEVVNKLGAKWLLKSIVDEEKLEDAIASGEIDGKEFKDCIDISYVTKITFKEKKV